MTRTLVATAGIASLITLTLSGAAQSQAAQTKSSMKADQVIAGWKETPRTVAVDGASPGGKLPLTAIVTAHGGKSGMTGRREWIA